MLPLVVAGWISRCVCDPLWLDRRPSVRRGLFDALPALLKLQLEANTDPTAAVATTGTGAGTTGLLLGELADVVSEAFGSCLAHSRKWDTSEMYQVLKLIQSAAPLLSALRRAGAWEQQGLSARAVALQSRLSAIRQRLVGAQSAHGGAAASVTHHAHALAGGGGDEDDEELDEQQLDEFSDWDEEEGTNDEMSASESGLLTCDILGIVNDIDAALAI